MKSLKLIIICVLVTQLYSFSILLKGPDVGIELNYAQNHWYIENIEEESWAEYQNLKLNTEVLAVDGKTLTSLDVRIVRAKQLTILENGTIRTLDVTYEGIHLLILKRFIMPFVYMLLAMFLSVYLVKRGLSDTRYYLILHLQFTALAYSCAGAAGYGDVLSNTVTAFAIFMSLVHIVFYVDQLLNIIQVKIRKKLYVVLTIIGVLFALMNVVRVFVDWLLFYQIALEFFSYIILFLVMFLEAWKKAVENVEIYPKLILFILCIGIIPFIAFFMFPTMLQLEPLLPADIAILFVLVVPLCFLYLEITESYRTVHYAVEGLLANFKLIIPSSIVLTLILIAVTEEKSFALAVLYFMMTLFVQIGTFLTKSWLEMKDSRFLTGTKGYHVAQFYRFIKASASASNYKHLLYHIEKELSVMLALKSIQIVQMATDSFESPTYDRVGSPFIYKKGNRHYLILHEAVDCTLVAVIDPKFAILSSGVVKTLELFLYYVQSMIENSLKMDELLTQLAKIEQIHSPHWYRKLWVVSSEREHTRLASEIHDTILQDLIRLRRTLDHLEETSVYDQHVTAFQQLRDEILDMIDVTRDICDYLYPVFLERVGVTQSLEQLIEKWKVNTNLFIQEKFDEMEEMSLQQATAIYRIVQELLSNVLKHAKASTVSIQVISQDEKIVITYTDDGVGMNLNKVLEQTSRLGVLGIQERIHYYGGTFEVRANEPQGTAIYMTMNRGEMDEGTHIG